MTITERKTNGDHLQNNNDMFVQTKKKLAILNASNAEMRREYSVEKIAEWEEVYVLESFSNELAYGEVEGHAILPVWPSKASASQNAIDGWGDHKPKSYSIEDFFDLIGEEDDFLISIYPVENKSGFILSVEEFMRDLIVELRNYEEE